MLRASICLSTFNKPDLLRLTLESIYRQRPGFEFETIVVDDGSADDRTRVVCEQFPVLYHRIDRPPVFRNPCTARNVAYRMAQADVVIAQSDEVLHVSPNTVQYLTEELRPGEFLMANVFCLSRDGRIDGEFVGPRRQAPYFFLGSMWREDLYAVGGNDEEFAVSPAWEDAWFGDCLIRGRGLRPVYSTAVVGHHQWHEYVSRPENETASRELYEKKRKLAEQGELAWQSAAGAWPFVRGSDACEATDVPARFTEIYDTNYWGCQESRSGFGSTLEATRALREKLPRLLRDLGVQSLVDAPCGDFHWMSHVDLDGICYLGADVVRGMIEDNRGRYPDREFVVADLLKDVLPYADAVLCRDCLQHMSPADVGQTVRNLRASGATYLLATTFTRPQRQNRPVRTGDWSPYNLEQQPFRWPRPLAVLDEECREWYPHFDDKSIGVWRLRDLEAALFPTKSVVVCVEFDDLLAITLPRNMRHFSRTLVVTSPADERTQELAARHGAECYVTDAFYRQGADFNKGAALEEAFDALGRDGWICVWDADVVMPRDIFSRRDPECLHSPRRAVLEDLSPSSILAHVDEPRSWFSLPCPTQPHEFDGYMQVFHAAAVRPPWYSSRWRHVGGGDSDFEFRFPEDRRRRLPYLVLHLGPEGIPELGTRVGRNWCGRSMPRVDGLPLPDASERRHRVEEMVRRRQRHGTSGELLPDPEIPRSASFFWAGRMSWLRYMSLASFRAKNPDWSMVLYVPEQPCVARTWTTEEDADSSYAGEDYFPRVGSLGVDVVRWQCPLPSVAPAQASDLLTWHVLGGPGGFVCDMDILWRSSLDRLWNQHRTSDAVFCLECGLPAVGFLGSKSGCKLFRDVAARARPGTSYQVHGSELLCRASDPMPRSRGGPPDGVRMVEAYRRKYPEMRIAEVPQVTVYPFDWRQIKDIFVRGADVPGECLGLHWFGGHHVAQKWNNLLTEENYTKYDNTVARILREVLR